MILGPGMPPPPPWFPTPNAASTEEGKPDYLIFI